MINRAHFDQTRAEAYARIVRRHEADQCSCGADKQCKAHRRADEVARRVGERASRRRETVRSKARALRLRVDSGERLSLDEARAECVTMADALLVFDRVEDRDGDLMPVCCGRDVEVTGGVFGQMARCPRCKAEARDATSPMFSPLLDRGDSYLSIPSEAWVSAFGARDWIVTHEGSR